METHLTPHPAEIDDSIVYAQVSKEKLIESVSRLTNACEQGILNPLELLTKLRFGEKVIKQTIENIMPLAVDEATKHNKGDVVYNHEITVQEAGTKYDYSKCNHPEYNILVNQKNHISDQMKDLEAILKANKTSWEHVDTSTGETFTIYPPTKTSTTTVICKIK